MFKLFKRDGIDVTVAVSAVAGMIDGWSITIDSQTVSGSDRSPPLNSAIVRRSLPV